MMTEPRRKPLLVRRVQFRWYALAILPILGLGYLALVGTLPPILAPIVLFALVFWIASFSFAVVGRLRGPRTERR